MVSDFNGEASDEVLTPEDAKDLGSAVTASLTQLILKEEAKMIDIEFKPEKMVF